MNEKTTVSVMGVSAVTESQTALTKQIGGDHYKSMAIQPSEYAELNGLSHLESSVVKYISRWKRKGGKADLDKAKHCIDMIIEIHKVT